MSRNLKIGIIINNYNYARFLSEAIDSALNQSYPHTEVIVVDDGSTDNSREIISEYGDRIIPIFQKNGKQGAALNSGFAASQGDIIIFLDADDYLFPRALDRIVEVWKPEISKVHYRLQVVDIESKASGAFVPTTTMKLASGEVWRESIRTGGYVSTCMSGNAYNRACLTKLFPIPVEYKSTADDYLMISTPFYGEVIGIEDALGTYRIHDNNQWALTSVSGSRFRRFVNHDLQNFALLKQRVQEFGLEIPDDLEMRGLGRLWSRLASLRLEPQAHPIESDRSIGLIYWGMRALWKFSEHNWQKKVIYSIWFLWVGLLPKSLAEYGITWLYAPHLRPKAIDRTLTKVRSLVS
jgi:glycosyltransferase involved in cell wall biosynthesis